MIRVERCQCPPSLDGPSSRGGKERERAEAHFTDPATRGQAFKFRAYKGEDVREALERMFGLKCAYCESIYAATAPMTVEHYRPKGGYDLPNGERQESGYYWLGSAWTNLLPSCTDCNTERGHDYDGTLIKTGKANRFPLVDEAKRVTGPEQENGEEPLLLDPTVDRPENHLEFGDEGVVKATEGPRGEDDRGRETIEVLGLRRPKLVRVREGHLKKVDGTLKRYRRAQSRLDRGLDEAEEELREAKEELDEFMEGSTPYAGMARQRIRRKLGEEGLPIP